MTVDAEITIYNHETEDNEFHCPWCGSTLKVPKITPELSCIESLRVCVCTHVIKLRCFKEGKYIDDKNVDKV